MVQTRQVISKHDVNLAAIKGMKYDYCREIDLPRLLNKWSTQFDTESIPGLEEIVVALHRQLRMERRRGLSGHWHYDINRHLALLSAYKRERSTLGDLKRRKAKSGRNYREKDA